MTKSLQILKILERRISHGDYLLKEVPAERELAEEIGVSRMTARKAVQQLVEQGVLRREVNGRLAVNREAARHDLSVAFLVPSLSSHDVEQWRLGLDSVASKFNASVRTILYVHWDDPVIIDSLRAFDGIFLNPSCETIPPRILERLKRAGKRIVVIGQDLTSIGIPSLVMFAPVVVQRLLDMLAELGHRHVDCFNVQTIDPVIQSRIEQWNLWRAAHRMGGCLLGDPVEAYTSPLPQAYEQMGHLLDTRQVEGTALLCTTAPAAIGAARAIHDRGLRIPEDISICVVNDEGLAQYTHPSFTSISMPDLSPYLSLCMEWLGEPEKPWIGSLLVQPADAPLFVGESTAAPHDQASLP